MSKLAIIVEPHFIERHVGVRNYTFALAALLRRHVKADFVSFFRAESGSVQWFKITLRDPAFASNCGLTKDVAYVGSPREVYEQWKDAPAEDALSQNDLVAYTHYGPNLAREGYDACVISNPWLLHLDEPIPIREQYGVAYDAIPNRYVLGNANKPFAFAAEHARGYDYFRRHCRATFAISEATRADLLNLFGLDRETTLALPPLLPVSYFDATMPEAVRGPSVVLASPLDKRKGLAVLPKLINPLVADGVLKSVLMYGGPRCSNAELEAFFDALDPEAEVCWSPRATATTVKRLLASARLCLFPSTSEGLGLPVLEAQVCGCRVLARDIEPVNGNLLAGSILLRDDGDDAKRIREAVQDSRFDHAALRQQALKRFNPETVERLLLETMNLNVNDTMQQRIAA